MDWFHLTLSFNTPIVLDLKAEATSAAERLQKIGERVGLPAHSRSDSYFRLADEHVADPARDGARDVQHRPPARRRCSRAGVFQEAMQAIIRTGRSRRVAT